MYYYSFNDAFEKTKNAHDIKTCLLNSLKHFKSISSEFPENVKGILTDKSPNNIKVNNELNLVDIIMSLNRDEKNYALKNFTKFPIEDFFPEFDVDDVLINNYTIKIENSHYDAFCAKINQIHDGLLFTLALSNDLKNNQLGIFENLLNESPIDNLFGDDKNTEYNHDKIKERIESSKIGFDKFISLFNNPIYFESFRTEFNNLTVKTQEAIISKFSRAKERKLPTYFSSDKDIIKDVTPEKENQIKLFELRVFDPVCVRLYFFEESNENVYLASVSKKPARKVQNNEIKTSIALIKSLIKIYN